VPWERIYAIGLILVVIIKLISDRNQHVLGPVMSAWFLFLLSVTISWIFSIQPSFSWEYYELPLKLTVFGVCITLVVKTRSDLRLYILGWVLIVLIYQAKSLEEYFFHGRYRWTMGMKRLLGMDVMYGGPNEFAATAIFALPLVFWLLRVERAHSIRLCLYSSIPLAITVVVFTGSRAGFLTLMIYLLIVLLLSRRKLLGLGLLAAAAMAVIVTVPDFLVHRFGTIFDSELDESATISAEGRKLGVERGFAIALRRPLTGVGPGCTRIVDSFLEGLPHQVMRGAVAHSITGQLLGDFGFTGAFIWFVFFFVLLISCARVIHRSRKHHDFFLSGVGRFCLEISLLVFLFGFSGDLAFRYQWIWIAAVVDVARRLEIVPLIAVPKHERVLASPRLRL
jgi:putative inorganic carbon (hco3(-)) transporter